MSDDKFYKDGDVVWVKLGNNWWPGEVTGIHRQPEGLVKHLKRKPYCVVKFFQEDSFEYVKSSKQIFPFNCNKKDEFIKKGLALYNAKNKFMDKFPGDVEIAERLTRRAMESDVLIINDRPDSIVKAILGQTLTRVTNDYYGHDGFSSNTNTRRSGDSITKILNITPNRTNDTTTSNAMFGGAGSNSNSTSNSTTPTTASSSAAHVNNSSPAYRCNLCNFTSLRQNVMIFHRKTHSASSTPITPVTAPKATTPNKETKENPQSINISPSEEINKHSNDITTTPLTSKGALKVSPADLAISTDLYHQPTKLSRGASKEDKTSSPLSTLTLVTKAPHLPSSDDNISFTPDLNYEERKSSLGRGSKKKDSKKSTAFNKRKSLRSSEPEVITVLDESLTVATASDTSTKSYDDDKTRSNASAPIPVVADSKPKRNSEEIIRSWQAEWSDEEEIILTPTAETVVEKTINTVVCKEKTVEHALKSEDISPVVTTVCTPPVVTSRIRNIPKKDRRDIILKEFPPNDLCASNSQSSASITPPVIVTIVDSGSSSNSNSSESVVVVGEVLPIVSAATAVMDDVIDVDAVDDKNTEIISKENPLSTLTEQEPEPNTTPQTQQTAAIPTWSCFDFQEEEDNDNDVLTSIAKFKKKHLSPDKSSQVENQVAIKKSEEDLTLKDKQLSADIETLLNQTKSTVVDMTIVATKDDVPVKALPIKERGKRIFKSRNRSRFEEQPNVGAGSSNANCSIITSVADAAKDINTNETLTSATLVDNVAIIGNQQLPEDIQTNIKQAVNELQVEESQVAQLSFASNDNPEIENINIYEENIDTSLVSNGNTLPKGISSLPQIPSSQDDREAEKENKLEAIVLCASDVESEVPKGIEIEAVEPVVLQAPVIDLEIEEEVEPKDVDIAVDDNNIFDDEVIPVIKHAPVEIYKEESTTHAENNVLHHIILPEESQHENEKDLTVDEKGEDDILENTENNDSTLQESAKISQNDEISESKATKNEEPEQTLVLPLQVNTTNEVVETDTTSRFTSPTDENSSIGISEAGAEFGSPTSMLDDERLPIVAGNLMTGIERLVHDTNLAEVEVQDEPNTIEQTAVQEDSLRCIKDEKVEKEKSSDTIETNNQQPGENEIHDFSGVNETNTQPLEIDAMDLVGLEKSDKNNAEDGTTEDDDIESPPHEQVLSENELQEEQKREVTKSKKAKTRKKLPTSKSNSNNLNNDDINNISNQLDKIEKKKKSQEASFKEKEDVEPHEQHQQIRTTRQSAQKHLLEEERTPTPSMGDKDQNIRDNAHEEVIENNSKSTLRDRAFKQKTKKKENKTTALSSDENTKYVEIKNETSTLIDSTKDNSTDEHEKESKINETAVDEHASASAGKVYDLQETDKNVEKIFTETVISSEIPKNNLIDALDLLINIPENSENKKILLETIPTLENIEETMDKNNIEESKGTEEVLENKQIKVVSESSTSLIATEKIKVEISDNKEISQGTVAITRKRRSHIKITPRKRATEISLNKATEATKVETKTFQTEAKMRRKSDDEIKSVHAETSTTGAVHIEGITTKAETSVNPESKEDAATEFKTDETSCNEPIIEEKLEEVSEQTASLATSSNILSEMRSFRPRRKTNYMENTSVLTTTTEELSCENDNVEMVTTATDEKSSGNDNVEMAAINSDADRVQQISVTASHEEPVTMNVEENDNITLPNEISSSHEQSPEKVHINVDVANPLSSQIANILATSSGQQPTQQMTSSNKKHQTSSSTMQQAAATTKAVPKSSLIIPMKRKKSIEDDIPSFIIERPCAKTAAAASANASSVTEKEAFAHVQNNCPQVKITRKETIFGSEPPISVNAEAAETLQSSPTKMFILSPSGKHQQLESDNSGTLFDIGNMPILLANEQLISSSAESVHIVLTPTATGNVIESIATEQLLSPTTAGNQQTSILMHVVPTKVAKSPTNDGPKIIKQQILQVPQQQQQIEATEEHLLNQQEQLNMKSRKPTTNTRNKRLPTRQQQQLQSQQPLEANEKDDERNKKQFLTPHQRQIQEQQRLLLVQKQQYQNASSQTSNKQMGVDSRGNKYVIIKTSQPPSDLVIQQPQVQQQLPLLQKISSPNKTKLKSPNSLSIGTTGVGTMCDSELSSESSEQQQQPKQKSPAAAATGGRKQAGNIITLPSNAAVKQQQQQFIESIKIAAEATVPPDNLLSTTSPQPVVKPKTSASNKNLNSLAAKSSRPSKSSQLLQQPEPTVHKKLLTLKDKPGYCESAGSSSATSNRRLSAIETSLPRKIAKKSASSTFIGDVVVGQQQQSEPPPLHHLHNKRAKKQPIQQHQQQKRLAPAINNNKKVTTTSTNITETNDLLEAISQQQQQQEQQPSTSSSSQQQQQSVHSTTISEEQLMQIQSEDQIDGTSKILAVPTQPIPGYNETFLLCTLVNNNYKPIDNIPLYLDHDLNQLVPVPLEALDGQPNLIVNHPPPEDIVNQLHSTQQSQQQQNQNYQQHSGTSSSAVSDDIPSTSLKSAQADSSTQMICLQPDVGGTNDNSDTTEVVHSILEPITHTSAVGANDGNEGQMAVFMPSEIPTDNAVILNIEGQQIILDAATFAHLLANPDANTQLITDDGTEFVLTREVLAALEAQQDTQEEAAAAAEQHQRLQEQLQQSQHQITEAGPTDILAVALAGSDLYGNEVLEIETSQGLQLVGADGIVFQPTGLPHQHLTPPITAQTSETNALLNQTPIMSTLEKPSTSVTRNAAGESVTASLFAAAVSVADLPAACRPNLEDSLAVIGVTTPSSSVPTSLELPITVTNPAIAPKSTMAGPTAPVGLASTSSIAVTESVQFQCLPHRTGGMSADNNPVEDLETGDDVEAFGEDYFFNRAIN